jgi:hypothetical protein
VSTRAAPLLLQEGLTTVADMTVVDVSSSEKVHPGLWRAAAPLCVPHPACNALPYPVSAAAPPWP